MSQFSDLDKKRLNNVLSSVIRASTMERFKTSRTPEGKRWEPSKRAEQEAGKTLVKTGTMKNSIRRSANDSGFAVGTNNIYAATHQFGTPGRRITIRAKTSRGLIFKIGGQWVLAEESRMDSSVVICEDGNLEVVENRNLKQGQKVILGRSEQCQEGIHVHNTGFETEETSEKEKFVFRQGRSRETSYARDYDNLLELLKYEKEHGNILWVMGPAFSFDHNARKAMQALVENGYAHGLMAGNALATHDLEGALLHTALGQDIYTQVSMPNGHYNHLDVINRVRRSGSIPQFIEDYKIDNGIIYSCVKKQVPFVLTGSIRDDGPMPEVIGDAYAGQRAMRQLVKKSTCVICLATMLHTIATGNMTPSFRVLEDGTIRPLYLYTVDADEFVVNKLLDRGSLSATTMVTNVQDFITIVARGLGIMD